MRYSFYTALAISALSGPQLAKAIRLLESQGDKETDLAENDSEFYGYQPAYGQA